MSINQEKQTFTPLLFFAPLFWRKTILFCSKRINKSPVKWFYTQWSTHVSPYNSQASSHFPSTKWMKLQIHTFVHQKKQFTTFNILFQKQHCYRNKRQRKHKHHKNRIWANSTNLKAQKQNMSLKRSSLSSPFLSSSFLVKLWDFSVMAESDLSDILKLKIFRLILQFCNRDPFHIN